MGALSNGLNLQEMQVVGRAMRDGATLDDIMSALENARLDTPEQTVRAYLNRWATNREGVYYPQELPEGLRD